MKSPTLFFTHFLALMATAAAISTFLSPLLSKVPEVAGKKVPHKYQYYVSYNCLSMRQVGRQQQVLHEFRHTKIVCLQGTRERVIMNKPVQVTRANGFTIVKAGYMHTNNSHSGVTIAVNNKMVPEKCIHCLLCRRQIQIASGQSFGTKNEKHYVRPHAHQHVLPSAGGEELFWCCQANA